MSFPTQYKAYVTPRTAAETYGVEVEITDDVTDSSGVITRSIDSTDFAIGLYTFNDVSLELDNSAGRYSQSSDSRSMFLYSRDLAKVRLTFTDSTGTESDVYHGLISEDGTSQDVETDLLMLRVLGNDAVLKKLQVPDGTVTDGMSARNALIAILNVAEVSAVLAVDITDINPSNNFTVDIGNKFDGVVKADAIKEILGASNSVMIIDDDDNVIVKGRDENDANPVVYLHGKGDFAGRENIMSLTNFNTGLHRLFNSIKINTGNDADNVPVVVNDATSIATYGLRQKEFSFGFLDAVNNLANAQAIAQALLDEFNFPKFEMQVIVPTSLVATAVLLDLVSVNYPLVITPTGQFLPVIGVTKIGDTAAPLPYIRGAVSIDPSLAFKIIEKEENLSDFTTKVKLRQIGTSSTDGIF